MINENIQRLIDERKIVVMIGPGGVGKTTSSVALALEAAKQGKSVALLSIDPAKRLAKALGVKLGGDLEEVKIPESLGFKGVLRATMLDQKAVFDAMVQKHAPSPHIADKILRDPLYIAASTNLSGPLEYLALAKLQELADSGKYDLVVLDTPPDAHALDFLARPNVLSAFLEGKVVSRILKPVVYAGRLGLSGVMSVGERFLGGVTQVTGFASLKKLGEFVLLMQEVIEGFHHAGIRVTQILKQPSTSFVIVTTPHKSQIRTAERLFAELRKLNYSLDGIVCNKTIPAKVAEELLNQEHLSSEAMVLKTRLKAETEVLARLHRDLSDGKRLSIEGSSPTVWIAKVGEVQGDLADLERLSLGFFL